MYTGQAEKYVAVIFAFGAPTTINAGLTRYLGALGTAVTTTEQAVVIPRNGILKNLYWSCEASGLTGSNHRVTVNVNGAATPLVASWNGNITSGNNTAGSVAVTTGQRLAIRVQLAGGGTTITRLRVTLELEVDDAYPSPWDYDPVSKIISYGAGNVAVNGEIRSNAGFRFPDGSVQYVAAVAGPPGPQGIPGPQGPQGVPGSGGGIDDSMLVASLMNQDQCGVNTYNAQAFVMRDGNVKIGGSRVNGSLGLGDLGIESPNPIRTIRPFILGFEDAPIDKIKSVHFCYSSVHILTQTGSVYGWGHNVHGEVGDGTTIERHTPQKIYMRDQNGVILNPQPKIVKLVSTQNGSADEALSWYALSDTGNVWSWGYNAYGQLALGDTDNRLVPTLTIFPISSPVKDIEAAGGECGSAFAITQNGDAWAVGFSDRGQTGLGTLRQEYWIKVPLPGGIPCIKVCSTGSSGYGHTLWLLNDGRVFAAGSSGYGQAGNPTDITGDPKEVPGLSNISRVWAIGGQHGCSFASRSSDGAFFAWGRNAYAQLGLGDVNDRTIPAQHPLTDIVTVAGASDQGTIHTVLLDANGNAYAAGCNIYGQCGLGYTSTSVKTHERIHLPVGVQGAIVQVGFMGYREYTGTQFLDAGGRVWVCGYNGGNMLCLGDTNLTYVSISQRVNM